MQYRTDKKTGNELSILGFGCMRFPRSNAASEKLILDAVNAGVNYFDTAYIYTGSEETLGSILEKHKLREKVFIADKMPVLLCKSSKNFDPFFNKHLERLKTNYIDYYLMHMLTDMNQWNQMREWGIEKWIEKKKASGQIKQIGFSFHGSRDEFMCILESYDWDFCQIQYNYSDENYQAGKAGLKAAAAKNIPVIIMEPLLGGKLANDMPDKATKAFKNVHKDKSIASWGLRWLWNQPEITVVLSGMNADDQLEDNLKTASDSSVNMLNIEELETINFAQKVLRESYKIGCTGCAYCMPCPQGVDIPTCFSAYNASYALGISKGRQLYLTGTTPFSEQQKAASLCFKCKRCEKHCPQNIEISARLQEVEQRMEPFWFKCAMSIGRSFLGIGKKRKKSSIQNKK